MREIKIPQSESKLRLLDAAEPLFAEGGFEVVSVRDITQRAKANVAAIHYHFGSRDDLIALVVTRYLAPIHEERLARLEVLERKWPGKAVPVEELMDAWVRPFVGMARKSAMAEPLVCKLLGRIFAMHGVVMPAAVELQARQVHERFTRALGKSLPSVTPEDLGWRMHLMAGAMIHMLMHQDPLQRVPGGVTGCRRWKRRWAGSSGLPPPVCARAWRWNRPRKRVRRPPLIFSR